MERLMALLLAAGMLFTSRTEVPAFPGPERMITEIRISCSSDSSALQVFSDQESMIRILEYLRHAEFTDEEVDLSHPESTYTITLIHSTGRITVYHQLDNRCLSKNNLPYRALNPEQAQQLSVIYRELTM
jgi:hypothetical protein